MATKYKFKAVGPRGAIYHCSTYSEALSKAKNPLNITPLGKRPVKRRGRPARLSVFNKGDMVRVTRPWVAVGGPMGSARRPKPVRIGARLVVVSISGSIIEYRFSNDTSTSYSMMLKFFMARVRPLKGNPLHGTYQTLYEILEVDPKATQDEIKKAYRKKAHELHPDKLKIKLGRDPTEEEQVEAAEYFKDAGYAYDILGDVDKRARYDRDGDSEVYGASPTQGYAPGTATGGGPKDWWWTGNLREQTPSMSPEMHEGSVEALFNYITKDPLVFDSAVQKTGRFITKSILSGMFDPETAPSVWYCAVASAVRTWALAHNIKPAVMKARPSIGAAPVNLAPEIKIYGQYTPEKIAEVAEMVADWFFEQLREDKYDLQYVFRVFGDIIVTGEPGSWDITAVRDPLEHPDFDFGRPTDPLDHGDDDDEFSSEQVSNPGRFGRHRNPSIPKDVLEKRVTYMLKSLDRQITLPNGKVVSFLEMSGGKDKIAAKLRRQILASAAKEPEPEVVVEPEPPFVEPEPEPVFVEPEPPKQTDAQFAAAAAKNILALVKGEIANGVIVTKVALKAFIRSSLEAHSDRISAANRVALAEQLFERTVKSLPKAKRTVKLDDDKALTLIINGCVRQYLKTLSRPHTLPYESGAAQDQAAICKFLFNHSKDTDRVFYAKNAAALADTLARVAERDAVENGRRTSFDLTAGEKAAIAYYNLDSLDARQLELGQEKLVKAFRHRTRAEADNETFYAQLVPITREYGNRKETFPGQAYIQFSHWVPGSHIKLKTREWFQDTVPNIEWHGSAKDDNLTRVWLSTQLDDFNIDNLQMEFINRGGKLEVPDSFVPLEAQEGYNQTVLIQFPDTKDLRFVPYNTDKALSYANIHFINKEVIHLGDDGKVEMVYDKDKKEYRPLKENSFFNTIFNPVMGKLRSAGAWQSFSEELEKEPWRIEDMYAMEAFTQESMTALVEAMTEAKMSAQFMGSPRYEKSPAEQPRNLNIVRSASNLEIYIPDSFKTLKVMYPPNNANAVLTPLALIITDVFDGIIAANASAEHGNKGEKGVKRKFSRIDIERINKKGNKPQHYLMPFTETAILNGILKKLPGFSTERTEELVAEILKDLAERKEQLLWALAQKDEGLIRIKKGIVPKSYQEQGIVFLMGHKVGILADDRGLGKTMQSIVAAENVRDAFFPSQPILIITPAMLIENFINEIEKFAIDPSGVFILRGGTKYEGESDMVGRRDRKKADGTKNLPEVSFIPKAGRWILASQEAVRSEYKVIAAVPKKDATAVMDKKVDPLIPKMAQEFYFKSREVGVKRPSKVAKLIAEDYIAQALAEPGVVHRYNGAEFIYLGIKGKYGKKDRPLFLLNRADTKYPEPTPEWVSLVADEDIIVKYGVADIDALEAIPKVLMHCAKLLGGGEVIAHYPEVNKTSPVAWAITLNAATYNGFVRRLCKHKMMIEMLEDGHIRETVLQQDWPLTIYDESHKYKNDGTLNFSFARELAKVSDRTWFLTGTPVANRLSDIWTSLYLASHPEGVGKDSRKFQGKYCEMDGDKEIGTKAISQLKANTRDIMLWRNKDDVALIPIQTIYKRDMEIPRNQLMYAYGVDEWGRIKYMDLSKIGYNAYTKEMYDPRYMGKMVMKAMKQIALRKAPYSFHEAMNAIEEGKKTLLFTNYSGRRITDKNAGFKGAREAAEAKTGTKLVVRGNTIDDGVLPYILEMCIRKREEDPDFGYVIVAGYGIVINGVMMPKGKNTQKAVDTFTNDPNCMLFAGHVQQIGTGLNLQAAEYSVFNDFGFQPAEVEQAEDRTRRINQTKCTTVVYTVAVNCAIEREKWATLQSKRADIERLQAGRDVPDMQVDPSSIYHEGQIKDEE